jgi:hypothetical protein
MCCTLSQLNLIQIFITNYSKVHFNIVILCKFRFQRNIVCKIVETDESNEKVMSFFLSFPYVSFSKIFSGIQYTGSIFKWTPHHTALSSFLVTAGSQQSPLFHFAVSVVHAFSSMYGSQ